MAKRFTDTDKWKRPWFRKLPAKAKMVWFYILDNCDHAGIWPADFDLITFQVGFDVVPGDVEKWFSDKIFRLEDDKYFVPSFIEFQYGELNPNNNAHKSVLEILKKSGADQLLMSPSRGAQDKEKEKDKDKDKEKEGDQKNDAPALKAVPNPDFIHPAQIQDASMMAAQIADLDNLLLQVFEKQSSIPPSLKKKTTKTKLLIAFEGIEGFQTYLESTWNDGLADPNKNPGWIGYIERQLLKQIREVPA